MVNRTIEISNDFGAKGISPSPIILDYQETPERNEC